MQVYQTRLKGTTPYSQSKHYSELDVPKLEKESPDAYDLRTWRNRMHVKDGEVFIPPMALKNCLAECAKYLQTRIPGRGKSTYTKHFEAGVMVADPLMLGCQASEVECEALYVPSDGRRGGSSRVTRRFPFISPWSVDATIHVLDETITETVLRHHLEQAGQFIGMGRFRPRNNGFYGRFVVESFRVVQ